ncbi:MAG: phenylalanine--tRNA ligase beta subunit-related protein [Candidatus Woesearchaeota archaeon]
MKITIKKEVFKRFSKLQVGFVYVEEADNKSKLTEAQDLLKNVEELIRLTFHKETIKNHNLISPWSVAQVEFGKEAKHYNTSVEGLLKLVLKKKKVATNDVLTTILNYISLRYLVPSGIDDYFKVVGNIEFALSKGKEKVDILRSLKAGALYYHDNNVVLGTKLDFWRNKRTALTKDSTKALIHFDALPPIDRKKLNEILKETKEVISNFCGGKVKVFILDKKRNSFKI